MLGYDQLEQLFGKVATEYAAACRKHPVYPKTPANEPRWSLLLLLERIRNRFNRSDERRECTIRSVQSEELLEAITAAQAGNWAEAKVETLHLMATAVRAWEYYDEMERQDALAKTPKVLV